MTVLWWARRDLRRDDNPALTAAAEAGPVLPVLIVDPRFGHSETLPRDAWFAASALALDSLLTHGLCLRRGEPSEQLVELARAVDATEVHLCEENTPFGIRRDDAVAKALEAIGVTVVRTSTPYVVPPGEIRKSDGTPYKVFTAYERAWRERPTSKPVAVPRIRWVDDPDPALTDDVRSSLRGRADSVDFLPTAGPEAALQRLNSFLEQDLSGYAADRDRPDYDVTTRLSPYLKIGSIHPRTVFDALGRSTTGGAVKLRSELVWREFYADVLHHNPSSLTTDLTDALRGLEYSTPGEEFEAWQRGETGFPIVDAGMRQLLAEGWMHNRVRMIVASFLTKDLHVWWPHGAQHFMNHLIDGDPASNAHGWQWVAGTGTDASPYFRVFNPVAQGTKFDPRGEYVRRYVPELRHLKGAAALEPWRHDDGYAHGYPERIVDHAHERQMALDRYSAARAAAK